METESVLVGLSKAHCSEEQSTHTRPLNTLLVLFGFLQTFLKRTRVIKQEGREGRH